MNVLVIGGTRFVGRHFVMAALARGHELTLFNRGRHAAEPFAGVETIHGDRHSELHKLVLQKKLLVGPLKRSVATVKSERGANYRCGYLSPRTV